MKINKLLLVLLVVGLLVAESVQANFITKMFRKIFKVGQKPVDHSNPDHLKGGSSSGSAFHGKG